MYKTINVLLVLLTVCVLSLDAFGQNAKLPESTIKTVYIVPFSHYDFGFVEPPEQVRARAARHIDEVIRVAEENPNFKWTIESVWQVNEWLKRQRKPESVLPKDKEKIERLMKLIRSGRIAMSMAWGSMHTDFMGGEELNRLAYDFTKLKNSYNISSELAMMNDVPGHPTSLPSVMAGSGAKYMVTGANTFINNATALAPGKVPFYWEGPDGSKVLLWISQGNRGAYVEAVTEYYLDPFSHDPYTARRPFEMFNPDMIGKTTPIQEMEIGMTTLLNRYNQAGYKYDAVMAMYSHDFVEPTDVLNLQKAIALWKRHHPEIELKIATPPEFFKYIEGKYGSQIPTFKGEWSGLWSEAKTQSPRISAMARYTQDHAPAAETLWSAIAMIRNIPAPVGNFASIWDLTLTYDEHSGAGNNGWPQLNSRQPLEDQNKQYVEMTSKAKAETSMLLRDGVKVIAQPTRFDSSATLPANVRPVVVYNDLSWTRSDVVKIAPSDATSRITAIRNSAGTSVPFDVDESGNTVFVAKDIPAFGYSTFEVSTVAGRPATTLRPAAGTSITLGSYAVEVAADGTISSIRDTRSKRELVNSKGELPFNELLRVEGSDASTVVYPRATKISVKKGLQMSVIEVTRPESAFPTTTITLYNGLDHVELRNELDPSKLPFAGGNGNWNDAYYFAFPFNVSADTLKLLRGGQKWFDTLPEDYMDGARKDSVTTRHSIGVTDGKQTVMTAHRQAFHWTYSGFVSTKVKAKGAPKDFLPAMYMGKFPLPEATLYSRAIRHSNQADTHDLSIVNLDTVEPGLKGNLVFEYAFSASGVFDPVAAWRLGIGFNVPLRAQYVAVKPARSQGSYFSADQPNVQIVTVKPLADSIIKGEVSSAPLNPKPNKLFVIRLQEFAGRGGDVRITLPVKIKAASIVSLTEDREISKVSQTAPLTVAIKPYQTLTVKVEIE
jgi:alpha-mannosidase